MSTVQVQNKTYNYVPTSLNLNTIYTHQTGGKEYLGRVSMTKNEIAKILIDWYKKVIVPQVEKIEEKKEVPVVAPLKEEPVKKAVEPVIETPKVEVAQPKVDYSTLSVPTLEKMLDDQTKIKKELENDIDSLKAQISAHPHKSQELLPEYSKKGKEYQEVLETLNKIEQELDRKYDEGIHSAGSKEHEAIDSVLSTFNVNPEKVETPVVPIVEEKVETPVAPIVEETVPVVEEKEEPKAVQEIPNQPLEESIKTIEVDLSQYEIPNFTETQNFKDHMKNINGGIARLLQDLDTHYVRAFASTRNDMTDKINEGVEINNELKASIEDKNREITNLREENARNEATIQAKDKEIGKLNSDIKDLQVEQDKMSDYSKGLLLQVEDKETRIKTLEESVNNLQSDLLNTNKLKDVAEAQRRQAESESLVWKKQAETASRRLETLESRLNAMQNENSNLKAIKADSEVVQKRFDKERQELLAKIQKAEENSRRLQDTIARNERNYTDKLNDAKKEISGLKENVGNLNKENATLSMQVLDQKHELKQLTEQNKSFQTFVSQLKSSPMGNYFQQVMEPQEENVKTR